MDITSITYALGWYVNFVDVTPGGGGGGGGTDINVVDAAAQTGDVLVIAIAMLLAAVSLAIAGCLVFKKKMSVANGLVSTVSLNNQRISKICLAVIAVLLFCISIGLLNINVNKAFADNTKNVSPSNFDADIPYMTSESVDAYVNTETGEINIDNFVLRKTDIRYTVYNGLVLSWMPEFGDLQCGNAEFWINDFYVGNTSIPGNNMLFQYFASSEDLEIRMRITDVPIDVLKTLVGNTALSVNFMGNTPDTLDPDSRCNLFVSFESDDLKDYFSVANHEALVNYVKEYGWEEQDDKISFKKQVEPNTKLSEVLSLWYQLANEGKLIKITDGYSLINFIVSVFFDGYPQSFTDKDVSLISYPGDCRITPHPIKEG